MGECYSLDLRERITRCVEEGHSRREAARRFAVSASCAVKWVSAWKKDPAEGLIGVQ
jgi:transposase